jgi:hypothetical protein
MGLGELLDELACGVGGHIWIQNTEVDGVMVCTRCGVHDEAPPLPQPAEDPGTSDGESLVPEHRPWLEPPYTAEF